MVPSWQGLVRGVWRRGGSSRGRGVHVGWGLMSTGPPEHSRAPHTVGPDTQRSLAEWGKEEKEGLHRGGGAAARSGRRARSAGPAGSAGLTRPLGPGTKGLLAVLGKPGAPA